MFPFRIVFQSIIKAGDDFFVVVKFHSAILQCKTLNNITDVKLIVVVMFPQTEFSHHPATSVHISLPTNKQSTTSLLNKQMYLFSCSCKHHSVAELSFIKLQVGSYCVHLLAL